MGVIRVGGSSREACRVQSKMGEGGKKEGGGGGVCVKVNPSFEIIKLLLLEEMDAITDEQGSTTNRQ